MTPAWMTVALTGRAPGALVEAVEIGSVDQGTNARARCQLVYRRGSGPSSVFVKRAGRLTNRAALVALGALTNEARLARSGVALPLDHPLPYAAGIDRVRLDAVVVMDDVVAAGGTPHDATTALSAADVRTGLDGLARLHGAFWGRRFTGPLGFLRPWRLTPGWSLVSVASLARGLRQLGRTSASQPTPWRVGARRLGHQFRMSALLAASGHQTMLHGDPHPGNTYATAEGRTGFLDWQLARSGHWSHDVGYFLVASLGLEDRRAHERQLLAGYLDALGHAGGVPPSWDDAWARYRATPAYGLATWLHTLSFGTFQQTAACLATIERFAAAYDDLDTDRSEVSHAG